MIKVKNLTTDKEGRVDFDVITIVLDYRKGEVENEEHYHTDKHGEGLWTGYDYIHQIEGLCDFHLRQKTYSGKYKAIKELFRSEY